MNKILVKLYVPMMEEQYDVWIPLNKRIYNVIILLVKAINEFTGGNYRPDKIPILYDKLTVIPYDVNAYVRETNMKNGTEIILI